MKKFVMFLFATLLVSLISSQVASGQNIIYGTLVKDGYTKVKTGAMWEKRPIAKKIYEGEYPTGYKVYTLPSEHFACFVDGEHNVNDQNYISIPAGEKIYMDEAGDCFYARCGNKIANVRPVATTTFIEVPKIVEVPVPGKTDTIYIKEKPQEKPVTINNNNFYEQQGLSYDGLYYGGVNYRSNYYSGVRYNGFCDDYGYSGFGSGLMYSFGYAVGNCIFGNDNYGYSRGGSNYVDNSINNSYNTSGSYNSSSYSHTDYGVAERKVRQRPNEGPTRDRRPEPPKQTPGGPAPAPTHTDRGPVTAPTNGGPAGAPTQGRQFRSGVVAINISSNTGNVSSRNSNYAVQSRVQNTRQGSNYSRVPQSGTQNTGRSYVAPTTARQYGSSSSSRAQSAPATRSTTSFSRGNSYSRQR